MALSTRAAAIAGLSGAVIGAVGALTLQFVEPQVGDEYASSPLGPGSFRVTEVLWTLSHVLILIGVIGFVRSGVAGRGRVARWVALIGFALQVVAEFGYVFFARSKETDTGPELLSGVFGVSSILIGLGLIGLGAGVIRSGRWRGSRRYAPLAWGIWSLAFIPLTFGSLFFVGIASWCAVSLLLWGAMLTEPAELPAQDPARI